LLLHGLRLAARRSRHPRRLAEDEPPPGEEKTRAAAEQKAHREEARHMTNVLANPNCRQVPPVRWHDDPAQVIYRFDGLPLAVLSAWNARVRRRQCTCARCFAAAVAPDHARAAYTVARLVASVYATLHRCQVRAA
jgi:hypothetical protein